MSEVDIYLFLGWLAASRIVEIYYDQERHAYYEKSSGKTIAEIATEYLKDIRGPNGGEKGKES